jgi:hypothetical protein
VSDEPPPVRLVPKPEGYEWRDKRSNKSNCPADWTPADALYDASQRIEGKQVTDLVVYWWEHDPQTGKTHLKLANATSSRAEHGYFAAKGTARAAVVNRRYC